MKRGLVLEGGAMQRVYDLGREAAEACVDSGAVA